MAILAAPRCPVPMQTRTVQQWVPGPTGTAGGLQPIQQEYCPVPMQVWQGPVADAPADIAHLARPGPAHPQASTPSPSPAMPTTFSRPGIPSGTFNASRVASVNGMQQSILGDLARWAGGTLLGAARDRLGGVTPPILRPPTGGGTPPITGGGPEPFAPPPLPFTPTLPGPATQCPDGWRWNPDTGTCETEGLRGATERILPGGRSGTMADFMGEPVMGAMGIPAVVPQQVGTRYRGMGLAPILQCPTGMILGKDELCYVKGSIPRGWRKWPPRAKPPISAADAKAIRKADSARNRVKRLAQKTGFSCKKR